MTPLREQLSMLRVMPVLTVQSEQQALAVCDALASGGILAVEITLRTPAALAAIRAVKAARPDFYVAAGTIRTPQDMKAVAAAGVDCAVSPGWSASLSAAATALGLPFLPGVSTASEIIQGSECGHQCFKFYPAEAVGGIPLLKALAGPFAGVEFCPTGGISPHNYRDYLALANVLCVGGSWMVDPKLIEAGQWDKIESLSRACMSLNEQGV
jgi:2-dehydro-3-deoxyphosphogluconate aldolase/(4S)-4-hydroxy-2-oxoglutarate aldolase